MKPDLVSQIFSILLVLCIAVLASSGVAAADQSPLEARRGEYLEWIVDNFGRLEPSMRPLDGRAWSLNQARLSLDVDTDQASEYFESVTLTNDADFMGIRLLKTLLDFGSSDRLSSAAVTHLREVISGWPMDRKNGISRVAKWPPVFTENHDLMHLTIGVFSEQFRGEDIQPLIDELKKSLAWRFERGFYEWGSHRYQLHYSNPLLVLAEYAPDASVRKAAEDLFNLMLAERALMSVVGWV
ncbi:MAG: hypothetical protein KDA52_15385 [Planctomycetaceae bacterium]|nr:hypothetical protein [Planctomycetaceae bacterium]